MSPRSSCTGPLAIHVPLDALYVKTIGGPPAVASKSSITSVEGSVTPLSEMTGADVNVSSAVDPTNVIFQIASAFALCVLRVLLCGVGAPLVTAVASMLTPEGHVDAVASVKLPEIPWLIGTEICVVAFDATDATDEVETDGTEPPLQPTKTTNKRATAKPPAH